MCNCKNSKDKDYVEKLAIIFGQSNNVDVYLYQSSLGTWNFCTLEFIPKNIINYVKVYQSIS